MRIIDWSSDVCASVLIIDPLDAYRAHYRLSLPRRLIQAGGSLAGNDSIEASSISSNTSLSINSRTCILISAIRPSRRDLSVDTCGSTTQPKKTLINTRSEEHTSELQSLMRNSYAFFCLKKKNTT